jgi:hypothetical protein
MPTTASEVESIIRLFVWSGVVDGALVVAHIVSLVLKL